jgi:hypothetical protein
MISKNDTEVLAAALRNVRPWKDDAEYDRCKVGTQGEKMLTLMFEQSTYAVAEVFKKASRRFDRIEFLEAIGINVDKSFPHLRELDRT